MSSKNLFVSAAALALGIVCLTASSQETPSSPPAAPGGAGNAAQTAPQSSSPRSHMSAPNAAEMQARQAKYNEIRKLVAEYKANPTEENKAKISALAASDFDQAIKYREARLEQEKAAIEKMKKDRETMISKAVEHLLSSRAETGNSSPGMPAASAAKNGMPGMLPSTPPVAPPPSSASTVDSGKQK